MSRLDLDIDAIEKWVNDILARLATLAVFGKVNEEDAQRLRSIAALCRSVKHANGGPIIHTNDTITVVEPWDLEQVATRHGWDRGKQTAVQFLDEKIRQLQQDHGLRQIQVQAVQKHRDQLEQQITSLRQLLGTLDLFPDQRTMVDRILSSKPEV